MKKEDIADLFGLVHEPVVCNIFNVCATNVIEVGPVELLVNVVKAHPLCFARLAHFVAINYTVVFLQKKKHYKSVSPVDPWQHTIIIYCIFLCVGHNFRNIIKGQFHRRLQHVVIGQISHQLDFTITRKQINFILILTGKLSLFSTSIFSFYINKKYFLHGTEMRAQVFISKYHKIIISESAQHLVAPGWASPIL